MDSGFQWVRRREGPLVEYDGVQYSTLEYKNTVRLQGYQLSR